MKKIILLLAAITIIFSAFIYLYIPTTINLSSYTKINCPSEAINRFLANKENIKKWRIGKFKNDSIFSFKNISNIVQNTNAFGVTIKSFADASTNLLGTITTQSSRTDTSILLMKYASFNTSNNPFERVRKYRNALTLKKQMDAILSSIKTITENTKIIYGFDVEHSKVKDSVYIFTEAMLNHYPAPVEVNNLINKLKEYIVKNNVAENDFPMLNVHQENINEYTVMLAIPISHGIPTTADIKIKRMFLGNLLIAKITGGQSTIDAAEKSFKYYVTDFGFVSPAIPYQSIATDRVKEQDTSKWITYLKYPVF